MDNKKHKEMKQLFELKEGLFMRVFENFKIEFLQNACFTHESSLEPQYAKTIVKDTRIENYSGDMLILAMANNLNVILYHMILNGYRGVMPTIKTAMQINNKFCINLFKICRDEWVDKGDDHYTIDYNSYIYDDERIVLDSMLMQLSKIHNLDEIVSNAAELFWFLIFKQPFECFNDIAMCCIINYYLMANRCMPIVYNCNEIESLSLKMKEAICTDEWIDWVKTYIYEKMEETMMLTKISLDEISANDTE